MFFLFSPELYFSTEILTLVGTMTSITFKALLLRSHHNKALPLQQKWEKKILKALSLSKISVWQDTLRWLCALEKMAPVIFSKELFHVAETHSSFVPRIWKCRNTLFFVHLLFASSVLLRRWTSTATWVLPCCRAVSTLLLLPSLWTTQLYSRIKAHWGVSKTVKQLDSK